VVAVVGVAGLITAGYNIFDAPTTAEMIGYTRGDGGFQWENAMGDLAIGVAGPLCHRYRDNLLWTDILLPIILWFLVRRSKPTVQQGG
jgi:hypothetical protein